MIRSIGGRRETRTGYLFDGQLILVKPDNLRKNQCFYRERIDLFYAVPTLRGHCKYNIYSLFLLEVTVYWRIVTVKENFNLNLTLDLELMLSDESGLELIRVNLSFKKESDKEKWFQLLETERSRTAQSPNRKNHHDFERERPKSAVMVKIKNDFHSRTINLLSSANTD